MMENKSEKITPEEKYQVELRTGIWIFFLLVVFTIGEYVAAVVSPTLGWLLIFVAIPKAYFVVTEYMHVRKLWSSDEEEH